jgi:predicted ATPase
MTPVDDKGGAEQIQRLVAANGLLFGEVEKASVPATARRGAHERGGDGERPNLLAGLARTVATHEGELVASTSASLTGWFEDARDAFAAALEAAAPHVRLAVHAYPATDEPIDTGDLIPCLCGERGETLAAALADVAGFGHAGHGGQVLASPAAERAVGELLPRAARLTPVGHWLAEGQVASREIYQLRHATLPHAFPPLRSTRRPPGELPVDDRPAFVGRDHELAELRTLLVPGRLVTVVGSGGTGKTRLVAELIRRLRTGEFPDGVRFCDVATATDADDLVEQLALAFERPVGIDRGWGGPDRGGRAGGLRSEVVDSLRGRLLLALDGCDPRRTEVGELVADVLRPGCRATVLATCRTPLSVSGEIVMDLGPLGESARPGPVRRARSPAAELLAGLAGTGETAAVDDTVLADLGRLANRAGALPLALELVAPLVRRGTARDVWARLDRHTALDDRRGDLPERRLAAVIDLTAAELSDEDVRLFAALSTFSGDGGLDAAEAVATAVEIEPSSVAAILARLTDRALVRVDTPAGGGAARYRMLDTVQADARARLDRMGRRPAAAEAHARYFLRLARSGVAPRRTPSEAAWARAVEVERDNLRAAQRWFVERRRLGEALELVWCLADDAMMRGRHEVGRWAEALATDPDTAGHPLRGAAFAVASNAALVEGDRARAEQLALDALAAGTERSAGRWIALSTLALVAATHGDEDLCRDRLLALIGLAQSTGDRFAQAVGLYEGVMLGRMANRQTEARWAAQALSGLVGPARLAGDASPSLLAIVELGRGLTESWTNLPRARRHLENAMALAWSARNTLLFLQGLRAIHQLDLPSGDRVEIVRHLRDVAEQFRLRGNAAEQVQTLVDLVWHLPELGAHHEATLICGYLSQTPFRHLDRFRLVDEKLRDRAKRPAEPGGDAGTWEIGAGLSAEDFTRLVDDTVERLETGVA